MLGYISRIAQYIVVGNDATLAPVRRHGEWPGILIVEASGPDQSSVLNLYITEEQAMRLAPRLEEMLMNQDRQVSS